MSSSIEPRVVVSICETNLNDQFEPSFRDNRDRNSQQETTSLPTRWNKTKKQNRDASRVVYKTFREDMSYPASARNIPNNNIRRAKASWQDDDIDITCHQTHMPIQLRQVMSPNPHSLDIPENSISGRFQPQNRTNGEFEPVSGSESPQKTNFTRIQAQIW